MQLRLGIDIACRAPYQASLADESGRFLFAGHRFRTIANELEELCSTLDRGNLVVDIRGLLTEGPEDRGHGEEGRHQHPDGEDEQRSLTLMTEPRLPLARAPIAAAPYTMKRWPAVTRPARRSGVTACRSVH
jgi:hypothetical protein